MINTANHNNMAETLVRPRVFLDVQIGTQPAGRIVIELFTDKTPKTCEKYDIFLPQYRRTLCDTKYNMAAFDLYVALRIFPQKPRNRYHTNYRRFTGSSMTLWFKVEILQREMAQEDKVSMGKSSRTRTLGGVK